MDTFLAVASRREVRDYADRPLPDDAVRRILEAGRIAGSSRNRQQRSFVVVADPGCASASPRRSTRRTTSGAALVVAVTVSGRGPVEFDAGRAAQNMMLVAWNEGIGSCPNGMPDAGRVAELLGLGEDERPMTVLTFGYPARARDPDRHSAPEWLAHADRKPLNEVVRRV